LAFVTQKWWSGGGGCDSDGFRASEKCVQDHLWSAPIMIYIRKSVLQMWPALKLKISNFT